MFQETEHSYISRTGNPKKLFIFQKVTFRALKKCPIFQEMELSSSKL